MSHVIKAQFTIVDLELLKKAVQSLGGSMVQSSTYRWYGQHVGDYPLPEGFSANDLGKCQFAISHPSSQYDIGVVRSKRHPGQWELLCDFWGTGENLLKAFGNVGAKSLSRLAEAYTAESMKKTIGSAWSIRKTVTSTGVVQLEAVDTRRATSEAETTKRIVAKSEPNGSVAVEAFGFKGKSCLKATKELEKLLGMPASHRLVKAEYFMSDQTGRQTRATGDAL
ncbi:DUF2997 domain-containing protein [Nitrospira sp. BLG_2]|uniref:DUF2997 domain-containing protein n=1 Tax=Nitrospira sp. BLG_2 TaxID=3397507 RepID=UPI003B9B6C3C